MLGRFRALVSRRSLAIVGSVLFSAILVAACGADDTGFDPPLGTTSGSGGAGGGQNHFGGFGDDGGPPPVDAGGLCGNTVHQIVTNAPNVVFVFDTSGSMATVVGLHSRFTLVRDAALALVQQLGPLINVGAARFPADVTDEDQCHVGQIVMSVSAGDADGNGPTTAKFANATLMIPNGGTPLAPTLDAIRGPLGFVPGKTFLVLATDGGPNCNDDITCSIAGCGPNIEGQCDPSLNCCEPGGLSGPEGCVDTVASTAAVKAFHDAGMNVYVVGITGSDVYEDVLGQLAIAGGGAQAAYPYYYKVDDLSNLQSVFGAIASLNISCDFTLTDPPPKEGNTNVYLDSQVIPYDPANGWTWLTPTEVELHGSACDELKTGKVKQVQIVSGCPTVVK